MNPGPPEGVAAMMAAHSVGDRRRRTTNAGMCAGITQDDDGGAPPRWVTVALAGAGDDGSSPARSQMEPAEPTPRAVAFRGGPPTRSVMLEGEAGEDTVLSL